MGVSLIPPASCGAESVGSRLPVSTTTWTSSDRGESDLLFCYICYFFAVTYLSRTFNSAVEGEEDHKEDIQNVIKEYHDRWRTILQMLTGHEVNIQADVMANLCSIGLLETQSLASKTNNSRKIYHFYQEP